jgi:hypothetical protein
MLVERIFAEAEWRVADNTLHALVCQGSNESHTILVRQMQVFGANGCCADIHLIIAVLFMDFSKVNF